MSDETNKPDIEKDQIQELDRETQETLLNNLKKIVADGRAPENYHNIHNSPIFKGEQLISEWNEEPMVMFDQPDGEIPIKQLDQKITKETDEGGIQRIRGAEPMHIQLAKIAAQRGAIPTRIGHSYTKHFTLPRREPVFFSASAAVDYAGLAPAVIARLEKEYPEFNGKTLVEIGRELLKSDQQAQN